MSTSQVERSASLLVELGTEELPPKALKKLSDSFANGIFNGLEKAGLLTTASKCTTFATPRRLAVRIDAVIEKQADRMQQRRGPAMSAAFDDNGEPSKALQGFARSCGVAVEALESMETDKGKWMVFDQKVAGEDLSIVLNTCLDETVRKLPIPKRMRWGTSTVEFVRPVHWLLALYDDAVLDVSVLGLSAGRKTFGHRFHAPEAIELASTNDYETTLKDHGMVQVVFAERQAIILNQLNQLAEQAGANVIIDQDLLDLVTGLVEWPQAIMGSFDESFLQVPREVLISSMQDHQKYFHLQDDVGNLLPKFMTVSNIVSSDPDRVRSGNERVLRARLSDGEFFWQSDLKKTLDQHGSQLDGLLFHKKLGTVRQKVDRIGALCAHICAPMAADTSDVARAVDLCKVDLVTDMVGEFPELQGVIGRYYAAHQGEKSAVSQAIEEHYMPRFSGDQLPSTAVGQCIALADRIDSLVGIFASGEIPSGDKDPYGLRRAALGVIRILIEGKLSLDLVDLIQQSLAQFDCDQYAGSKLDVSIAGVIYDYIMERLKGYYQNDFSAEQINAVLDRKPSMPLDFHWRLTALKQFYESESEAATALAAANKRIANILAKNQIGTSSLNQSLLTDEAEKNLADAYFGSEQITLDAFAKGDYARGLKQLATLREPIDRFFDDVMVMAEDEAVRVNRLTLLSSIRALFLEVADISRIRVD